MFALLAPVVFFFCALLCLQEHPDKGGDPERFKEISKANDILSDPEKRKLYVAPRAVPGPTHARVHCAAWLPYCLAGVCVWLAFSGEVKGLRDGEGWNTRVGMCTWHPCAREVVAMCRRVHILLAVASPRRREGGVGGGGCGWGCGCC